MNSHQNAKPFHIWQQNMVKSSTAQHDLLAKADPKEWDIIALQEPYLNHLHLTHANPHRNIIYPSNKNLNNQPHSCSIILLNTNIHPKQTSQISINSSNITAVLIVTNSHPLIIINMYNDNNNNNNNNTINIIKETWEAHKDIWLANPNTELIILSNFNCHHSTWESCNNAHLTNSD
jgi:hypothetical protein